MAVAVIAVIALAVIGPLAAIRQSNLLDRQKELTTQLEIERESLRLERQRGEQQLYDSLVRLALAETDQASFDRASEVVRQYAASDMTSFEFSLLQKRLHKNRDRTIAKHWCDVTQVAVDPNHNLVAYGTWDGTVVVLDGHTGRKENSFRLVDGTITWIEALEFSPDGRFLFVGGDQFLQLRRVSDWSILPFPKAVAAEDAIRVVYSAQFGTVDEAGRGRTWLAIGDRSGYKVDHDSTANLLVYEIDDVAASMQVRLRAKLAGIQGAVNDIEFDQNEKLLLACGRDAWIRNGSFLHSCHWTRLTLGERSEAATARYP